MNIKKIFIYSIIYLLTFGVQLNMPAFSADYIASDAKLEYNQGVDFYKLGQYDKSMAAFRRAIKLDPNYIDAYYNLGSILQYLNQDEAALNIFKQVMIRKPDDYESVYKAAYLSNKLGQIDSAKKYLSLIPANASIYQSAQSLARAMGSDMQTIKAEAAKLAAQEAQLADSSNKVFNDLPSPTGIASDNVGNIYVACFSDNMIYKITPDGKRMLFVKDAKINGPIGMVSDIRGNLYIANYNNDNVIKITPAGAISTVISNVQKPYGLNITNGMLYISSQGTNSVLRYKI